MTRLSVFLALFCLAASTGCKRNPPLAGTPAANAHRLEQRQKQAPREIWKFFDGERALADVRRLVEIGPRPSGHERLEQARILIEQSVQAAGWTVERQAFESPTPRGNVKFVNLIARFPADDGKPPSPAKPRFIVASHYDTKLYETIRFVGANDGGSSTGALIELARVLSLDPALASQIELVFFDGEEAVRQFSETDGLYGSRYYARVLRETKRNAQFVGAIVWDMIGERDLTITLPPDTPPELSRDILAAADALGLRSHFGFASRPILDDHVPLIQSRIPAIDIIDFDYLQWHTADDTIDKLSAESLQKIGAVTLYYLRHRLEK